MSLPKVLLPFAQPLARDLPIPLDGVRRLRAPHTNVAREAHGLRVEPVRELHRVRDDRLPVSVLGGQDVECPEEQRRVNE